MTDPTEIKSDSPRSVDQKRPKSRWLRRLFVAACLLVVLLGVIVASVPTFISTDTGRRFILGMVSDGVVGSIDADGLTVRWGRGQSLWGITVRDSAGVEIVSIGRIELPSASLRSIVLGGLALGELQIESVSGEIIGYDDGTTNLSRALTPSDPSVKPSKPTTPTARGSKTVSWPSGLSLGVTLRDMDITYRAHGADDPIRLVIPELTLSALDPKHMVLVLDAQLSQGGNRGHTGRATADIRIDDLFDAAGLHQPDLATIKVDAELIDLPIDALDQLLGREGKLVATLGPILNGKVDAELTTDSGFAEIQAVSEHLRIKSRWVFDEDGLVSDGPGEARLTLTPDAWLAHHTQGDEPTSTLLEPVEIKVDVRRLSLPWNKQGLALNDAGFDLGLTISDTRLMVKEIGEVKLTSTSAQLVADKLSGSVRAQINVGIEYPDADPGAANDAPPRLPGSIESTTTVLGLRFTPEGLDTSAVTYHTDTHILRAPIDLIDALMDMQGELVGALGPRAKVDAVGSYTPSEDASGTGATGGIDLLLESRTASIDAKLLIADGRWTLKADAPLSFQVTPRLSQTVLKKVNPFLGSAISAKLPISVNVKQDGFWAPLRGASLADINADVLLELGELDLKGEGVLLKLLQQLGVDDSSLLNVSFSPVTVSLAGGKLSYKDLTMTIDQVRLSFSGQVDLNTERLDLSLTIPGDSLAGISWLKGAIDADQVIVIPLTGTFDKPELDFRMLAKELGKAALDKQIKGKVGDAIGDKIGGEAGTLLGSLLNELLKEEQPNTQPDETQTQPDEQAQPKVSEVEALLSGLLNELLKPEQEQPQEPSEAEKK